MVSISNFAAGVLWLASIIPVILAGQFPDPLAMIKSGATYTDATHGFTMTYFNGTNTAKEAAKFTKDNNLNAPFTLINPTDGTMCVLASYTDLTVTPLNPVYISFNSSFMYSRLPVPANSSVLANFLPTSDGTSMNGRVQAFFDCNSDCSKCPGDKHPRHTLVEYAYGNKNGKEELWTNLSTVDGITSNANVTVFGTNGKTCHKSRACSASAATMKKTCPAGRLWKESGNAEGCQSDCSVTGSHEHCCTGPFGDRDVRECPKSSQFLKELCPDAYAFPHDDAFAVDACYSTSGVRLEFSPFHNKKN